MGWVPGPELPTFLAETIVALKPGEVAKPVADANGFHIVRLNDRRSAAGDIPPTWIGGCGRCTGSGRDWIPAKELKRPWKDGCSCVHSVRITSMCSETRAPRSA